MSKIEIKVNTWMQKGEVYEARVIGGNVYMKLLQGGVFVHVGYLPKEEYSWGEDVDTPDGDYKVVVLDPEEGTSAGIRFGYKHLSDPIEYIKSLDEDTLKEMFFDYLDLKREKEKSSPNSQEIEHQYEYCDRCGERYQNCYC